MKKNITSLADANPELAAQWHPTKNGDLTPDMVTCGSHKKVWWLLPYDDPETGKHFDFEWESKVSHRTNGSGCPFLSGQKVWYGYNDLATKVPQLAKEWHPTKNGNMKPENVAPASNKKVWWCLPYDDPETGKHFEFEWEASVSNRIKGSGCPYLSGKKVWIGYNDLATKAPKLAEEWHPTKNGTLLPTEVPCKCGEKVWWRLLYTDPETGKCFDFEWEASPASRANGNGCPFLSGQKVWVGYNDLATKAPELAKEWHPTKNGNLMPTGISHRCGKKVWWYLPFDDPETGEHFDFEWEATPAHRTGGVGCPFLSGKKVWIGYNDLATKEPELALEWHPTKNGSLTPENVVPSSNKKVWWYRPYDDPETGKHFEFEWEASINSRTNGSGCPFLSGQKVWIGYNDLATKAPELAKEWHPIKNGILNAIDVTCGHKKNVWWYLPFEDPETGKHFDFEWEASPANRMNGCGCPFLSGKKVWTGYNDLATKAPELALEWHPTKNGNLKSTDVTCGYDKNVWWCLPFVDPETGKSFLFEWRASPYNRVNGNGCPFLIGRRTWPGFNDLATKQPDLAREWHPAKNRKKMPDRVYAQSRDKAWWKCPQCGYEWRSAVYTRTCVDELCPECKKRMPRFI